MDFRNITDALDTLSIDYRVYYYEHSTLVEVADLGRTYWFDVDGNFDMPRNAPRT